MDEIDGTDGSDDIDGMQHDESLMDPRLDLRERIENLERSVEAITDMVSSFLDRLVEVEDQHKKGASGESKMTLFACSILGLAVACYVCNWAG